MGKNLYTIKEDKLNDLILNLKSLTSINNTAKIVMNYKDDFLFFYVLTSDKNIKSSKFIIKKFSDYFEHVKSDGTELLSNEFDYIIYNINNLCENLQMFKDYKLQTKMIVVDEYVEEQKINLVKGVELKNDKLSTSLAVGNHTKIDSLSFDKIKEIVENKPLFEFNINKTDYSNLIKLITKTQKSQKINIFVKDSKVYIKSKIGGDFNMKFDTFEQYDSDVENEQHYLETDFIRNEKIDFEDVTVKVYEYYVIFKFNDTYLFLGKAILLED